MANMSKKLVCEILTRAKIKFDDKLSADELVKLLPEKSKVDKFIADIEKDLEVPQGTPSGEKSGPPKQELPLSDAENQELTRLERKAMQGRQELQPSPAEFRKLIELRRRRKIK